MTANGEVPVMRQDGKVVGFVTGTVFRKLPLRASEHMLRRPRAWCNDLVVLRDAERLGATMVEIPETESGLLYAASMKTIWAQGWRLNRGHGEQWAVRLEDWTTQPLLAAPVQLTLSEPGT